MSRVYEEIIDFISSGTTSKSVAEWHPSASARSAVDQLLAKAKDGALLPDDKSELDHYLELEHLMRLAKARARELLIHE